MYSSVCSMCDACGDLRMWLLWLPLLEDDLVAAAEAADAGGHAEQALETHDALVLRVAALGEHGELALGVEELEADSAGVGLLGKPSACSMSADVNVTHIPSSRASRASWRRGVRLPPREPEQAQ